MYHRLHTSENYTSNTPKTPTLVEMQRIDNHPLSIQHTLGVHPLNDSRESESMHLSTLNLLRHSLLTELMDQQ